ncbi:hypothetical protein D3P08_25955 [Paenibacillus nanensis]|uniref:Outer membrane protein assembly factor BamE n=1 Tax=Paenibacillus nanensis TaxID=393251 RepID=A0A3A1UT01_9BACL|nr:hypothetical protein [Paenibacillus nanensis]RIX46538.1 hypothetical protein D3P08_25955 [Paenibacillus nanensis]
MYKSLLLIILAFLTACSSVGNNSVSEPTEPVSFEAGAFVDQDLSLVHAENKKSIKLGMSRKEVEKLLGEPTESIDFMKVYIYSGIKVHYAEDIVDGMMIDDNTPNPASFQTPRGLQYGDSLEQIESLYGEPQDKTINGQTTTLVYLIEKRGDQWEPIRNWDEAQNKEKAYSISINVDAEAGMFFYMAANYQFSVNPTG